MSRSRRVSPPGPFPVSGSETSSTSTSGVRGFAGSDPEEGTGGGGGFFRSRGARDFFFRRALSRCFSTGTGGAGPRTTGTAGDEGLVGGGRLTRGVVAAAAG